MRITDLQIQGFGVFAEQKLTDLSSGVNIFIGNNEAGKSTCLAFLRYMLFGLPRKGKGISHHEPLRGGNHAGALGIDSQKFGTLRLERSFKPKRVTITQQDGSAMEETALQALLGNVSRDLYTNVYGFSLTELQSKEALSGDAVRNALYGTVHGGGASYTEVMKNLAAKREALFKKGGKVLPLNKNLKELEQLRKDLNASEDSVAAYLTVSKHVAELEKEVTEHNAALRELATQEGVIQTDLRLWKTFSEYKEKKIVLDAEEPHVTFPAEGLSRFETHARMLQEKREQLASIERTAEQLQREIVQKKSLVNKELVVQQDAVRALSEEKAVMAGKNRDVEQLEIEYKTTERELTGYCDQLGSDWTSEKIAAFDISENTRREVAELEEAITAAHQHRALTEAEYTRLGTERNDAKRDVEQCQAAYEADGDVQRLAALTESSEKPFASEEYKETLRDIRARLSAFQSMETGIAAGTLFAATTFGVTGLALLLLPFITQLPQYMMYAGGACLLFALGAVFLQKTKREKNVQEQKQAILNAMATVPVLFPTPEVSEHCLLNAGDIFGEIQQAILVEKSLRSSLITAQQQVEQVEARCGDAEKAFHIAEASLEKANTNVHEWLKERGMNTSIRIQHVPDMIQLVKDAKAKLTRISEIAARKKLLVGQLHAYNEQQDALCTSAEIEPELAFDRSVKRDATQDKLLRILTESLSALTEMQGLSVSIQREQDNAAALHNSIAALEKDINGLFAAAEVTGEEEFRSKFAVYTKQQTLLTAVSALKASLTAASDEGDIDRLVARIGQQSEQELRVKASELAAEITGKETALEDLRQKLIEAKVRQEKLTSTEERALVRAQGESVREESNNLAREWARYKIAEHLLSRARERFEREQQPEVIKQAGMFFSTITKGAYSSVFKPLGEDTIFAVAEDGTRREPDHLSRGTVEQLYLSLRLGHILSHSAQNEALPVIMDDIMVNFDPDRAATTAQTIAELSKHNQVFLFTCHPQTVDLMQRHVTDSKVFSVTNGILSMN